MALTTAQLQTLQTYIESNPAWTSLPNTNAGNSVIGAELNAVAVPDFIVWRRAIPTLEIGQVISYVALAAMTTANLDRVKTFQQLNPTTFEGGRSDIRTYMSDTFSGALGGQGQATRDALEATYRRKALLVEKVLATGTGSTASPAVMGYEGTVTTDDIEQARAL